MTTQQQEPVKATEKSPVTTGTIRRELLSIVTENINRYFKQLESRLARPEDNPQQPVQPQQAALPQNKTKTSSSTSDFTSATTPEDSQLNDFLNTLEEQAKRKTVNKF